MKKILSILFLLTIFNTAFALNRGDIREQIRYMVRDTTSTTNSVRWADSVLNSRIEISEIEFVKLTRALKARAWEDAVTNQAEYELPNDWLTTERVGYAILPLTQSSTNYRLLEYTTIDGLDAKTPEWENSDADEPIKYYYRRSKIGFYPKPSSTYAGYNTIQLDYVVKPSSMTGDSDVPFNGVYYLYPYHIDIVWYVLYLCALDERDVANATVYLQKFQLDVDKCIAEMKDRPDKNKTGFTTGVK